MKNILKILATIAFASIVVCSAPAFASCDGMAVSGMNDAQIVELKQKCVDLEKQAAASPPVTAENIEEYANLGKKYGIALSEVAKSVGTTVNELAQTPVGIFMLVIVGWKTLGHDLLGVFGGIVWFTVMIPTWILFFRRLVFKDIKVTETWDPTTGKLLKRVTDPIKYEDGPGPVAGVMVALLIPICIAGFIMIF
jgi:hypothetical protein